MSNLFTLIAGRSEDTFTLGGVTFEAAPLTLMEVGEYFAFRQTEDGQAFDARCEWLAAKLRSRALRVDPITITGEWLLELMSVPALSVIEHILVHGELPTRGPENTKAP